MESLRMPDYRYIRTKSNIFEVVGETEKVFKVIGALRDPSKVYSKSKIQIDVLKRSNSIEDLCDEFVCIKADLSKAIHTDDINNFLFWKNNFVYRDECNFYAGIWVEKDFSSYGGLKFIAKLNDKGALELI